MNTSRRSLFKAAAAVAGIGIMPKFANASVPQNGTLNMMSSLSVLAAQVLMLPFLPMITAAKS